MRAKPVHRFRRVVFALALLVCLLLSAWSVSSPVQAAPTHATGQPACVAKLKPLLQAKMQQLRIPGAIIFVDEPGQCSWTTAMGIGNLATREPMHTNNYMRIGSITKSLTATVILQLVDQGKLRLDDPVGKYQPEVPNGEHITIRELLQMTSGLFSYSSDLAWVQALQEDPYKAWNPRDLVAFGFKHPPLFAPGQGWNYSNSNYILLGMIIEQITHQPVEKVFQQYIFQPLGMRGSSLPSRSSSVIRSPHAQGYMYGTDFTGKGPTLNVTDWNPSWGWTAGSAISTLHDLQIWARALATGQLLSQAIQKERLNWVQTGLSWVGSGSIRYGLGVADYGGLIGHNGQIFGYQSWMGYQPQKRATVIVLVNLYQGSDGSEPADQLAKIIQQELLA
jgi:D-alanyl-D-alanine carboxypeptidase